MAAEQTGNAGDLRGMPADLSKFYPPPGIYFNEELMRGPNRPTDWFSAAHKLFHDISDDLGKAAAQRIFKSFLPRTPKQELDLRNKQLLINYDMMPEPNVQKLALRFAEENKTLPVEQRYGPRGTTDWLVMDKHIRRLLKARRAKQPSRI
jgi:hypothetical protein